jgi:hypothetical protein
MVSSNVSEPNAEKADTDQLTNKGASENPLNKARFSQILLPAAGTSRDSNGASNFTQHFAIA